MRTALFISDGVYGKPEFMNLIREFRYNVFLIAPEQMLSAHTFVEYSNFKVGREDVLAEVNQAVSQDVEADGSNHPEDGNENNQQCFDWMLLILLLIGCLVQRETK